MIFKTPPDKYSLAGNPITIELQGSATDSAIYLEVKDESGKVIYSASAAITANQTSATFEISRIVKTLLNYEFANTSQLLTMRKDMIAKYSLRAWVAGEEADAETVNDLYVLPGTIGRATFNRIRELGENYNSWRYSNFYRNCFATTRSFGSVITFRDRELLQLALPITKNDAPFVINFEGEDGKLTEASVAGGAKGFAIIDLQRLFLRLGNPTKRPYTIKVSIAGKQSATIRVVKSEPTAVQRSLIFRNSLGAFDSIDLSGRMETGANIESEEKTYVQHLGNYEFENRQEEIEHTGYVRGFAGWKTPEEMHLIIDMLCSKDVYLSVNDIRRRVLVKATSDIISENDNFEPGSIELEIMNTESSLGFEDNYAISNRYFLIDNNDQYIIDINNKFLTANNYV